MNEWTEGSTRWSLSGVSRCFFSRGYRVIGPRQNVVKTLRHNVWNLERAHQREDSQWQVRKNTDQHTDERAQRNREWPARRRATARQHNAERCRDESNIIERCRDRSGDCRTVSRSATSRVRANSLIMVCS